MTVEKYDDVPKGDKRSRLRTIGLGLALVCGLAGAVMFALSDRTMPDLVACVTICAVGAWMQRETNKLAERLYGCS
ncbi:hypothetical protein ACFQ3P_32695 [Paraburkholderia sabiae]|uniref:Uncharacterized protein n=1 Tax=Paraburkholderia sabiae TaxID=273251 RepID=A0ABU9QJ07_9BURK|nr:hypothetical protein [Paraburkholderia sabiae]WJZ80019.1 hypothetical protein QEN71_43520 [Paraburkholderia sabiae]CAD6559502.1 hypothetical protein LMG24235_06693 [Paraburkholderia sabiae]